MLLIALVSVGANQLKSQNQPLTWTKQAAGVWKAKAGNPEGRGAHVDAAPVAAEVQ